MPKVHTQKRVTHRYDNGGIAPTYVVDGVPNIFSQIGRLGGKLKHVWCSSQEDSHSAHTYVLISCEDNMKRLFER